MCLRLTSEWSYTSHDRLREVFSKHGQEKRYGIGLREARLSAALIGLPLMPPMRYQISGVLVGPRFKHSESVDRIRCPSWRLSNINWPK